MTEVALSNGLGSVNFNEKRRKSMEDQFFQTGMLLLAICLVLRKCSNDDVYQVDKWWLYTIMAIFAGGIGLVFVGALMMIWL